MVDLKSNIIVFGPSQAGKSTFVNYFSPMNSPAKVGDGRGDSVTIECKAYNINNNRFINTIIDVPGIFDSRLELLDKDILEMIKEQILNVSPACKINAILLFESLASSKSNLEKSLAKLYSIFTNRVNSSIIVIASKCDKITNEKRLEHIKKYCQEYGLQTVLWTNFPKHEQRERQENELEQKIAMVSPVNANWIEDLKNEIKKRKEILEEQAKPTEAQIVEKAKELSNSAPKIKVTKQRETTKSISKFIPSGYWKASGGFFGSLVGSQRWVDTSYYTNVTVPYLETYTDEEAPPYTVFIEEAKKMLTPNEEELMKQASEEVAASYRSRISQRIRN